MSVRGDITSGRKVDGAGRIKENLAGANEVIPASKFPSGWGTIWKTGWRCLLIAQESTPTSWSRRQITRHCSTSVRTSYEMQCEVIRKIVKTSLIVKTRTDLGHVHEFAPF